VKREIKKISIICDCCETSLIEKNTLEYQTSYVKHGDIDLCFACTGKIFDINLKSKVSEENLGEWILSFKSNYNKTTNENTSSFMKDMNTVNSGYDSLEQVTSLGDL
jgi:hypothetical protein